MIEGFRVSVYWEKFGGLEEGSMCDERTVELTRKPTAKEMTAIERAVEQKAKELGISVKQ